MVSMLTFHPIFGHPGRKEGEMGLVSQLTRIKEVEQKMSNEAKVEEDVYDTMAERWGCSRDQAKHHILAALYSGGPPTPPIPEDPKAHHLHHVHAIAKEDADGLVKGDPKYGYSWKSRGGVGAYMMATRKADRLDVSMAPDPKQPHRANLGVWRDKDIPVWDIFAALEKDDRAEGVIDDIRDLRRYLLLIEAEARARGFIHGAHRDNATDVQHP